jgi:hypothetical protein
VAFVRTKRQGDRVSHYLVGNKREGKKVTQRVIKYLATELRAEDQIEAMRRVKNEGSIVRES